MLDDVDNWARLAAEALIAWRRTTEPAEAAELRARAHYYISKIDVARDAGATRLKEPLHL